MAGWETKGNDPVAPIDGNCGITIREYFAAKAMQGLLAPQEMSLTVDEIAYRSVKIANALIAALNEKEISINGVKVR